MAINSLSASSNGLSGLVSGMDTESMVKSMLSGTQTKIDTTNQKITQLEYKQELYRGVVSDLQKFQSTYFSYTNQSTNLLSQSFFQNKSASSTSSAYSATATTSAAVGNVTINSITSLATNRKQTAKVTASAGLGGTMDTAKIAEWKTAMEAEKLTIKVGDKSVDIDAKELVGLGSSDVEKVINEALSTGGVDAKLQYLSGSFTLTATDSKAAISITGGDNALKMVGGSKLSATGSASLSITPANALPSFELTVDGVKKTISFDPFETNSTSIADQLNKNIASAFGSGITVSEADGKLSFAVSNPSRKLSVTGEADSLALLGMERGDANKISLTTSLSENNFATSVVGQYQKFSINGVDFSFSSSSTVSSVMNAINSSDAGVTVSYSSTTDKFTIESSVSGARDAFDLKQSEGNLLTAMFGIEPSGNTTGMTLSKALTSAALPEGDFSYTGGTVNINVNGSAVSLEIEGTYTSASQLVTALNDTLLDQYGSDASNAANVAFKIDGGNISLETKGDYTANISDNSLSVLGFDATVNGDTTLADVGVTGDVTFNIGSGSTAKQVTLNSSSTIADMVSQINTAAGSEVATFHSETKPYIRICGVDIPMNFIDISGKLFGVSEGVLDVAAGSTSGDVNTLFDVTDGTNAVLQVNGVTIERNSNSFSVDGLSLTLKTTTDTASTIAVTQDTDKIYDTVVKFIEDYNTLVNSVNTLLDADPTYKDYDPLTTAQEDEMTESQVEKWETKAKEGLLRNDSTLTSVLSSLRSCLYTKPEGSMALYDLGISTSYFGTKDNLVIDDVSKLKTLISENPESIMKLFTDSEKGLSTMLNTAIDNSAKSSTISPGSLVRLAGSKGATDTSSSIYKQIKEYKEKLDRLSDQYENEYDRYWSQFNSMESLISQMNSTSTWLTSMTSS